MTVRAAPVAATWFLRQFGSNSENESAIGDLFEQYQRGRGSIWYWRQVMSIVFAGLYREFRTRRWSFTLGLFRAWCVCESLSFLIYGVAMVWLVRIEMNPEQRQVLLPTMLVILNVLKLIAVGAYSARSSEFSPRTMLLAFVASYAIVDIGSMAVRLMIFRHQPTVMGMVALQELIKMPSASALLLIGGMRGLSPMSLQKG